MTKPTLFTPDTKQGGIATEDLNATLLVWSQGQGVALHVNDQVDVIMLCLSGSGQVLIEGETFELTACQALVIPKGLSRGITSTSNDFRYLNVHKRKPLLKPLFEHRSPTRNY